MLKIISALILPPTSLILLAFVGLCICRKRPTAGRLLAGSSLIALLILYLTVSDNALHQSLETVSPISEAGLKDAQAIVILSGRKNNESPKFGNEDTVNRLTLQHLRYGAYLQAQTGKPILAAAAYSANVLEADAMAKTLNRDFKAKTIQVEGQSKDTAEKAEFSAIILKEHGFQRIALISQAQHLPRAIKLFWQQGSTMRPAPTGYSHEDNEHIIRWLPKASALEKSCIAFKEYLGRLGRH